MHLDPSAPNFTRSSYIKLAVNGVLVNPMPTEGGRTSQFSIKSENTPVLARISQEVTERFYNLLRICGHALVFHAIFDRRGIRSKPRRRSTGRTVGGGRFGVGFAYLGRGDG